MAVYFFRLNLKIPKKGSAGCFDVELATEYQKQVAHCVDDRVRQQRRVSRVQRFPCDFESPLELERATLCIAHGAHLMRVASEAVRPSGLLCVQRTVTIAGLNTKRSAWSNKTRDLNFNQSPRMK